jgi:hypothetical protein
MPTRRTDYFPARGDDGADYTIDIYMDFRPASSPGTAPEESTGFTALRLRDGPRVHPMEKGVYQTGNGLILRSDAPNAP